MYIGAHPSTPQTPPRNHTKINDNSDNNSPPPDLEAAAKLLVGPLPITGVEAAAKRVQDVRERGYYVYAYLHHVLTHVYSKRTRRIDETG